MVPAHIETEITTIRRNFDMFMFAVFMSVMHLGHSGSSSPKRDDEDITKFYAKGTKIWTLLTTKGESDCKVDNVTNSDNKSANFERRFVPTTRREPLNLTGTFTNGRKTLHPETYDAMDVRETNGNDYELRAKNLTNTHSECIKKFTSHTEKAGSKDRMKNCTKKFLGLT
ncbi:uncharacterized protein LOC142794151 isoform X2 [Rhipicephalus microplus]|uniref:uncharacterized protein LOC142794151 isoform X2 n=1 Tax=Rhipicephalus microplus TaxID=6941 RepID=UPI003F6C1D6B